MDGGPATGSAATRAVQGALRRFAATTAGSWLFARVLHRVDRVAFRLSGGRRTVTAMLAGLPVVMLTTTGARSGIARTVPVLGVPVGDDTAVAAGNFGSTHNPGWCANLRADPHAEIVVDGRRRRVIAEELRGPAREAVWRRGLEVYPGAAAYARRAGDRTIGVFLLHPDDA